MAKVSNWYTDSSGNYVVKYTDGTTKVLTQIEAVQQGVIKDPGTLGVDPTTGKVKSGKVVTTAQTPAQGNTSNNQQAAGVYGSDLGGAFAQDPLTGQYYNTANTVPVTGADGKTVLIPISSLIQKANDPKELGKIRTALVANGILSKGTRSKQAITNAYVSVLVSAAATSMNPNDWMKQFKESGGGVDIKATIPTPDQVNIREYTPQAIKSIAEQIYIKAAGRVPSKKELTDLVTGLNLAESKKPTTTTYTKKGGKVIAKTSGGIDEQQFITEQAKKASGFKETQTLNFENWLIGSMTGQGA